MKKATFWLSLLLFSVMIAMNGCKKKEAIAPAKQYAVEDFFKNPEKSGFQLSPDGKYYAFMAPYERRMNIFVQEIGKKEAIQLTSDTARDIAG